MRPQDRRFILFVLAVAIAAIIALMLIPAGAPEPGFAPSSTTTTNP